MQTLSDINIGWAICLCIVVGCFIYSKLLNANDFPLLPRFHDMRFTSHSTIKQLVAPCDVGDKMSLEIRVITCKKHAKQVNVVPIFATYEIKNPTRLSMILVISNFFSADSSTKYVSVMCATSIIRWISGRSLWVLLRCYWPSSGFPFRIYRTLFPSRESSGEQDIENSAHMSLTSEVWPSYLCMAFHL
jgi:hypothetical protein